MRINLEKNQEIFFTSDTHYGHSSICRGTSSWGDKSKTRNFETIDEMNEALVKRINSRVGENDVLVHLGDWSFGGFENIEKFRKEIKCKNIHLILGNHDHHIEKNKENIRDLFSSVNHYSVLGIRKTNGKTVEKTSLVVCHFPIASWDGMSHGRFHVHGHVHLNEENKISGGRSIDVGVDGNNLFPYSLNEIVDSLESRPIKSLRLPFDHHEI